MRSLSKRQFITSSSTALLMASAGMVFGSSSSIAAPSILSGAGNFRQLRLKNVRTGENANTVYWIDGNYIPEALDELNYILRDWRASEIMPIDTRVLDIVSGVHKMLDTSEPFEIVSGYRSPTTNKKLRKNGRGVATKSYHLRGMAMDVKISSRSVGAVCNAAKAIAQGGVGRYSRTGFVHMDCGPVRNWGR